MGHKQRGNLCQAAAPGRVVVGAVVIWRANAGRGLELVHGVAALGHGLEDGFFVHLAAMAHQGLVRGVQDRISLHARPMLAVARGQDASRVKDRIARHAPPPCLDPWVKRGS